MQCQEVVILKEVDILCLVFRKDIHCLFLGEKQITEKCLQYVSIFILIKKTPIPIFNYA